MSNTAREDSSAGHSIPAQLKRAREAQQEWATRSVAERFRVVRLARETLAARAAEIARMSASLRARPVAEVLSAEVLPLLSAYHFLESEGEGLLARQRLRRRGRPLWLSSVEAEIMREPRGVVLVIGPGNYPLLLPGVQILQALAAGNSVVFKPAPGTTDLAEAFRQMWLESALPAELFQLVPETVETAHEVIGEGVDFVVLTGSAEVGKAVLRSCAEKLTPSVMELSGCDAVVVCEDADLEIAAGALSFGLRINAGATCIAPRRVYVARRIAEQLEAHLLRRLGEVPAFAAPARLVPACEALLKDSERRDGSVLSGGYQGNRLMLPLVLSGGAESGALLDEEIFAPVLLITFVDSDQEAIELAQRSAYALGASVFSRDENRARRIAERLNAGVVLINDMIVPTADPRIPFGGRARSGFGVTRGAEGLLTMTVPKVISTTKGRRRLHFAPVGDSEAELFAGYITTAYTGDWKQRWSGIRKLWAGLKAFGQTKRQKHSQDSPNE